MTRRARSFQLESLEGRRLLTAASSPISASSVGINFAVPGTSGQFTVFGPAAFSGVVHAFASQQADSVTLSLQTTAPFRPRDSVLVDVATGPIADPADGGPAAQAGVQYQPVHQTVTFPPGVRSMPVTIPIVAGAANPGLLSFEVTATQLGVTADTIGAGHATETVFLARDINAASVPRIDGAYAIPKGRRTSDIALHFSHPMDPASVESVKAYFLQDITYHSHSNSLLGAWGPDIRSSPAVLKKATYNPSTNTVNLHLARSIDSRDAVQIQQSSTVLRDAAGTAINEDGSGLGGAFLITLAGKKAKIIDGVTQSVIASTRLPR